MSVTTFFDHRNRQIDPQLASPIASTIDAERGLVGFHDAHAAFAATAITNLSKWMGELIVDARLRLPGVMHSGRACGRHQVHIFGEPAQ